MKCVALIAAVALVGAGCGKPSEPSREPSVPAAPTPTAAEPAGTATITGKVVFKGTPPSPQLIRMGADPTCEASHSEKVVSEEVIVDDNGTLRNVFVYVKQGLVAGAFAAPREPVVLDQQGCLYRPHVAGIVVGQPLLVRNSDDTLHNIHAITSRNEEFNFGQPSKGMESRRTFDAPEVMLRFKCDVHPWMNAYLGVLPHPFFSVTGDGGAFALRNLPAGEYVIEAWHEKLGTQAQVVQLAKDESKTIEFVFSN